MCISSSTDLSSVSWTIFVSPVSNVEFPFFPWTKTLQEVGEFSVEQTGCGCLMNTAGYCVLKYIQEVFFAFFPLQMLGKSLLKFTEENFSGY